LDKRVGGSSSIALEARQTSGTGEPTTFTAWAVIAKVAKLQGLSARKAADIKVKCILQTHHTDKSFAVAMTQVRAPQGSLGGVAGVRVLLDPKMVQGVEVLKAHLQVQKQLAQEVKLVEPQPACHSRALCPAQQPLVHKLESAGLPLWVGTFTHFLE
jgi:hypothetical protein